MYSSELSKAMAMLAGDPRIIFIGQGVAAPGTFMSTTLEDVPEGKRLELPVAEEMQMGMAIGLALAGFVPVSIYPRWNFLLSAASQLVNHVDKMCPHVIVRVGIGSTAPLHPGPQHVGDYTEAFQSMLDAVRVERLEHAGQIVPAYMEALERRGPTLMVEYADKY